MKGLRRLLRRPPVLAAAQSQAAAEWRTLPAAALRRPAAAARLVVVDVESTGLDMRRDRLISIGAVAVSGGVIELAQSLEVVLRQDTPSGVENILVHRIGGTRQRSGADPASALLAFLQFAGKDPLVAFHADFDRAMIGGALDRFLGVDLEQPWLDLARLAPALLGARAPQAQALDDWLAALDIRNYARHDAVADAFATAQLLLIVLASPGAQAVKTIDGLIAAERDQRWLERR